MGDDRPDFTENDGALGRAALAGLAGRLARLPASHPSAAGYRPGGDTAPRGTAADRETEPADGQAGGQADGGDQPAASGPRAGLTWPWRRGRDEGARPGPEPAAGGGRPGGDRAGGDRDEPSLLDRLPRPTGPAGKQPRDSGRQRRAAGNPGGLGPRAGGAPFRPWFADGGEAPWFASGEEGPGG
jgi:hypothetical protein